MMSADGDGPRLALGAAEKFLDWDENVKKLEEIPHICTMTELVIHCLAAKAIIDKYRLTAEPVVALWNLFGHLIQYSLYEGNEYTLWYEPAVP